MVKTKPVQLFHRRAILHRFATLPAAGVLATTFQIEQADAYDPGSQETRARYHESDDVKAFYRTNGYETLKK
jgi:hypothetical protein